MVFTTAEFTKNAVLVDDWSQVSVTTTTADDPEMGEDANDDDGGGRSAFDKNSDDDDRVAIVTGAGSDRGDATALPTLRPRPRNVTFVPPARRDIWQNLKLTIQQPDIVADIKEICRSLSCC